MKKFIPSDFDLIDYDEQLLKKQLDLETVRIILNRDAEREEEFQQVPYYLRTVERFTNEEGMFKRLMDDLERIGQEYGVEMEEIHKIYFDVSCSKTKLVERLKGQSFTQWNELEDMALEKGTESKEYSFLLKTKGYEEIVRRRRFLGLH